MRVLGVAHGHQVGEVGGDLRSRRLDQHVARVRTAASSHTGEVAVKQLVVDLETVV